MTNVVLTATNPADSSVVPVACNAKGELKLEEPILVEGPKGDAGPAGPDGKPGKDGDPFTGNFSGTVYFDGDVGIGTNAPGTQLHIQTDTSAATGVFESTVRLSIGDNYGAEMAAWLKSNTGSALILRTINPQSGTTNRVSIQTNSGRVGIGTDDPRADLEVLGDLWCADKKAGFNSAGELIFFSRGKRYRAIVSNDLIAAEEYTPDMELSDFFDEWTG